MEDLEKLKVGYIIGGKLYGDIVEQADSAPEDAWSIYSNNERNKWQYLEMADCRGTWKLSQRAIFCRTLAEELQHYINLAWNVVSQTERRVLGGESVPAQDKIVSIFEPHTDIIRKDRRDTYYGHKVTLSGGQSGMILDWVVEDGNPADTTLLLRMLDRLNVIYEGLSPTGGN